ncbi:alpha/beta hydrolase [Parasphingorhabdus sp. JC815]|uniref:alpha/beta hydrolase n=1 Tax=Parasphingorhabdus sp. JC815 TaxID=3232140 RepID=UPI00345A703F
MTNAFVRPDTQAMLAMLAAAEQPPLDQLEPAAAREAYVAMRYLVDVEPTELAVIKDLSCPGPAGDIKLRYYDKRENREKGPAIIFYHGGGFVIGDLESHHPFCTEMAAQMDLPLIAVDYRLAPEAPFPAAPDDCEAATRWIAENASSALGIEIDGLIPCGDSAGGNLAIVVAQDLAKKPAAVPVIAQVPIYPVVDSTASGGSMEEFAEGFLLTKASMDYFHKHYAGKAGDVRCDPIHGDLASSPPTVLITGGLDPLRDQGRAYGAKLVAAGVPLMFHEAKGNVHGLICLRKGIPSSQQDVDGICNALKATLAKTT